MSSQHQDLWCSGRYWTRARSQPLSIRADRWARFTRALLCRICARYSSASLGTPFGFRPTLLRGPILLSYDFKPQPFSLSELTTNLPSFHSFWLPAQCVHSGCAFVQTHGPTTTSTSEEIHPKFLKVDPSLLSLLFFSTEVTCWTGSMMARQNGCLFESPHSAFPLCLVRTPSVLSGAREVFPAGVSYHFRWIYILFPIRL